MTKALDAQYRANLIRLATVAEVRTTPPSVKLKVAGVISDWRPYLVARAGNTCVASVPSVGEQGLLLSPFGDFNQSVFVPGVYSTAHPAPASAPAKNHVLFPDGSVVEYDSDSNTLMVDVVGDGKVIVNCRQATVTAATSVKVDAPLTTFTGAVTVQGTLTWMGGMIGYGVPSGSSTACAIEGDIRFRNGSLTHNGVRIDSNHIHIDSIGGPTGVPQ